MLLHDASERTYFPSNLWDLNRSGEPIIVSLISVKSRSFIGLQIIWHSKQADKCLQSGDTKKIVPNRIAIAFQWQNATLSPQGLINFISEYNKNVLRKIAITNNTFSHRNIYKMRQSINMPFDVWNCAILGKLRQYKAWKRFVFYFAFNFSFNWIKNGHIVHRKTC